MGGHHGLRLPHACVPQCIERNGCSNVIPAVDAVHKLFWEDVLSLAVVHLVMAELAAFEETFY
ncbi:hypothetical protein HMPREF1861_02131 [Corynebacterium kroppenstedtii]|nr:hypothetical protein HMPREF1861_02131 [Corynebacterium kroppenstedtii]